LISRRPLVPIAAAPSKATLTLFMCQENTGQNGNDSDQSVAGGPDGGLGPIADPELVEDVDDVALEGVRNTR